MKFIATTSDKIKDLSVISGQLIFSRDDRIIYLDTDKRTSFQQITILKDEQARTKLIPLDGFYFVEDTAILWRYTDQKWIQLTEKPKENLIFIDRANFPAVGKKGVLYCTSSDIYQWSLTDNDYIRMGSETWEPII